ncbi:phosphotransferase [Desertimonas flava]|uniref:phosphotransferase n=1 Tax=Desertimonas flava TaxID=2064846 RepID=UPI000E357CA7|nr:phosphotransferase [Desertimonas flava]
MRVPPRLPDGWEPAVRRSVAGELGHDVGLEILGSGLDCWAVRAGDDIVLRIPQHDDGAASVDRQLGLLTELAERMPVAIPAPLFVVPNPLGPGSIGASRFVAGEVADEHEWHRRSYLDDTNASMIARIIDAIASFPVDRAVELGVPVDDERADLAQELDELRPHVGDLLSPDEAGDLLERWERYVADDDNFVNDPGLVHADLSLDHLLIDDGRIVGLIDFGDVNVTDPDLELAYLWAEAGPEFVGRVQRARGLTVDARLAGKLDFAQLRDETGDILWAIEHDMADLLTEATGWVRATLHRLGDPAERPAPR